MIMEIQLTGNKTENVKSLIFSMLDVLEDVGIPLDVTPRRLEKMAMACMAVGDIKTKFTEAKSANDNRFLTTREIIAYENKYYGENISSGSYDDIRRKDFISSTWKVIKAGKQKNATFTVSKPDATETLKRAASNRFFCTFAPHFQECDKTII